MDVHAAGPEGADSEAKKGWPHCPPLGGTCLVYAAGELVGRNVTSSLLKFLLGAEDGARLTLQRNRDGFTVQVTGAVKRSVREPFDWAEVKAWQERVDLLMKERDQG